MSELEEIKEQFIFGFMRLRKWNLNKDNRTQKYSDQERYILLFLYQEYKKGIENVSASSIMKKLSIGKEVLSRTMRKLISTKAVLRKVDVTNKRRINYTLAKSTIGDCIVVEASINAEIESMVNILGIDDVRNLIRILAKAANAIELKEYLVEADD